MNTTISAISIVEKQSSHVGELRRLFLKVRKATFWWVNTDVFDLLDFDKETEGEQMLVAIYKNQPVGFISVWVADNFIHHLFVDMDYQHLGIATKLLNTVIARFGFPLKLKCVGKNSFAINFYKKRGFIISERGEFENEAFVLMELQQPIDK